MERNSSNLCDNKYIVIYNKSEIRNPYFTNLQMKP